MSAIETARWANFRDQLDDPPPETGEPEQTTVVMCEVCGSRMWIGGHEVRYFTAHGWPKCCDRPLSPVLRGGNT